MNPGLLNKYLWIVAMASLALSAGFYWKAREIERKTRAFEDQNDRDVKAQPSAEGSRFRDAIEKVFTARLNARTRSIRPFGENDWKFFPDQYDLEIHQIATGGRPPDFRLAFEDYVQAWDVLVAMEYRKYGEEREARAQRRGDNQRKLIEAAFTIVEHGHPVLSALHYLGDVSQPTRSNDNTAREPTTSTNMTGATWHQCKTIAVQYGYFRPDESLQDLVGGKSR